MSKSVKSAAEVKKSNRRKMWTLITIGGIVGVTLSIALPLTLNTKKTNSPIPVTDMGLQNAIDEASGITENNSDIRSTMNPLGNVKKVGNKYISENNLDYWNLDLPMIVANKSHINEISDVSIQYLRYDFDKKAIIARVYYTKDSQKYYRDVNVLGFGPAKVQINKMDVIETGEFDGLYLPTTFTIPSLVKEIKPRAFVKAILPRDFTIPENVKTIAPDAFASAKLPNGFTWYDKDGKKLDLEAGEYPTAESYLAAI